VTKSPDLLAEIHYFTTEQGGRKSYALSGYFPPLRFGFSESLNGGKQIFLDKEIVYPGEDVKIAFSFSLSALRS
jgi:elongation factor Tu